MHVPLAGLLTTVLVACAPSPKPPAASSAVPSIAPSEAAASRPELDVDVIDQDGRALRFGRDVVGDRTVVVQFVYTHCSAVCPVQGDRFKGLQRLLGERLDRDVRLVSISLDPENDTPAALKAWSARFGARPGWVLLTGAPEKIAALTTAIVGAPLGREMHSPFLLVGDARSPWKRAFGLAPPQELLALIAASESTRAQEPSP
jgi:protein SCO1/2